MPEPQTTTVHDDEFDITVILTFTRMDRDRLRIKSNVDLANAIDAVMDAAGVETGRHDVELMCYEAVVPIAPMNLFFTEAVAQNIANALLASEVESAKEQVLTDKLVDVASKLFGGILNEDSGDGDDDNCGDPRCPVHGDLKGADFASLNHMRDPLRAFSSPF